MKIFIKILIIVFLVLYVFGIFITFDFLWVINVTTTDRMMFSIIVLFISAFCAVIQWLNDVTK